MEIETRAEAKAVAAMIEKWSETLPEKKARNRSTRAKPSRQTAAKARQEKRQSRKANGDESDTETAQTSLI
jgi:hypothetical protein